MRKRRSSRRFLLGLLLYVLILVLIMSCTVFLLHRYLIIYEDTRPSTAIRAYFASLPEEGYADYAEKALAGLDHNLCPQELCDKYLRDLLVNADYAENLAESGDSRKVYTIRSGGKRLGTVQLAQNEEAEMGLYGWKVDSTAFDLSADFIELEVTVPPDWHVEVNGCTLDKSYRTETGLRYDRLEQFYDSLEDMPAMVHYRSGPCLPGSELCVTDAAGREIPETDWNQDYYLSNCSDEQQAALQEYCEKFMPLYIRYTADIGMERNTFYTQLTPLLVPGSPLDQRIREGVDSSWWNWTQKCTMQDMELNLVSDLGGGRYLVDLSYETETIAQGVASYDHYNIRLIVEDVDGRLLASTLYYY